MYVCFWNLMWSLLMHNYTCYDEDIWSIAMLHINILIRPILSFKKYKVWYTTKDELFLDIVL